MHADGIGFAIPVDTVRRVVNQIIRYGRVNRATLGINVLDDPRKALLERTALLRHLFLLRREALTRKLLAVTRRLGGTPRHRWRCTASWSGSRPWRF